MKIRHYLPEDAHTVNSCVNCGVSVMLEVARSAIGKAIAGIACKALWRSDIPDVDRGRPSAANGRKSPVADTAEVALRH